MEDQELFKSIIDNQGNCQICKRCKRPELKPADGFSLAKDFNGTLSMDLKTYYGFLFLHIIDHATRFSTAAVIRSKEKGDRIFKHWVPLFGCPKKVLSDNGGEFYNELFRDMAQLLNTHVLSTAAESPWKNCITDRYIAIIHNTGDRALEDVNCSIEVARAWALSAKNSLKNVSGYSPNQLVSGKNPNLPTVIGNEPPALEGVSSSKLTADHLNYMHTARKAFIESEASDKLRGALLRKTRTATSLVYEVGDLVYYKRNDSKRWRGPSTVIGKDRNQIYVKHGGSYLRVNPCHIRPVKRSEPLGKIQGGRRRSNFS